VGVAVKEEVAVKEVVAEASPVDSVAAGVVAVMDAVVAVAAGAGAVRRRRRNGSR
jgi:hypothetical protein